MYNLQIFAYPVSQRNKAYVNFLNAFCPASPKSDSRVEFLEEKSFYKRPV